MLKIAIIGYGHTGKAAAQAINAAGDMELCGVIMRAESLNKPQINVPVADNLGKLATRPDVAILCTPTMSMPDIAEACLLAGISTVDSYDKHESIWELRTRLDIAAKKGGSAAVVSAGWDPGSDSVVRALLEALAPVGKTFTNFGAGMSMGHTVAVKEIEGVKDALSLTIPLGTGVHRRMVYIEVSDGYKFEDIKKKITADSYFVNDETHVFSVQNVNALRDVGHAANIVRKGVSGEMHNQLFQFDMKINNPALTGQVLISCARAAVKQSPGAYTMIEIPVIDMLEGSREDLIRRLV
ncbi:MAG: diaminopimelate dehydrogenase [Defluviitaleaceae bacterium]|nr:diaminopimelate dehydrogenase [Defluviitaleaceae bacterium]